MGRKKYTEAERSKVITSFIRAAAQIIDDDGVDQVSIRKVATLAEYNSATMYLYFKDLDELITLACISFLEDYYRELVVSHSDQLSSEALYYHTWEVFCKYAFSMPQVFDHLFFSPHNFDLDQSIERFYEVFPNFLEGMGESVLKMVRRGNLAQRNIYLLQRLAEDGLIKAEDIELINALTVGYFRTLLEERRSELLGLTMPVVTAPGAAEKSKLSEEELVADYSDRFMEAATFLLNR